MKLLLALIFIIFTTPVLSADLVVYESNTYAVGSIIDSDSIINLEYKEYLKVIAPSGKIIEMVGKYNKSLDIIGNDDPKEMTDTLNLLFSSSQLNNKDLGVTRNSTDVIKNTIKYGWVPSPWVVDIQRSGDVCIREGNMVVLWRESTNKTRLNLNMNDEFISHKDLDRDEQYIDVPKSMPIYDNKIYKFEMDNETVNARFHIIPKSITYPSVRMSWMNRKGCNAQVIALLKEITLD